MTASFQLIPARGRKPAIILLLNSALWRFQLIPARGRKPWTLVFSFPGCVISTYPRKGTKTEPQWEYQVLPEDFNLSPQGDGNVSHQLRRRVDADFNLSPQGDGNRSVMGRRASFIIFQLIPAKPSQALRASSPEGRAFTAAVYPDVKLPLSGELARR